MSHGAKENKTIAPEAQVEGLKDGQKININLVQEKEKARAYVPCPEVVAYNSQPKKRVVFRNLLDGAKMKTDIAFNWGSGPGSVRIHLSPGKATMLPQCVIDHINGRRIPRYERVTQPSGEYAPGLVGHDNLYLLTEEADPAAQSVAQPQVAMAS